MLEAAAPSQPLYIEMEVYCRKNGFSLDKTFFDSTHVPQAVIDIWLNDAEFLAWIEERQSQSDARRWFYKDQPPKELKDNAVALMKKHFIVARSGESYRLYTIIGMHAAKAP